MRLVLPILGAVVLLAGCASQNTVPTPTPEPTLEPSETATAAPVELPDTASVTAALVTPDGTKPTTSFVSTVESDLPAVFEDSTANAAGTWMTRLACSSATGAELAVKIEPTGADAVQFVAPCGADGSITTIDGTQFATEGTYTVTFTSTEPAVASIGLFDIS